MNFRSNVVRLWIILVGTVGSLALLMTVSPMITVSSQIPTDYLTNYPSAKQTIEVARQQTNTVLKLTPFPTGTLWVFSPNISTPSLLPTAATTLNPNGEIEDNPGAKIGNMFVQNTWYYQDGSKYFVVQAGGECLRSWINKIHEMGRIFRKPLTTKLPTIPSVNEELNSATQGMDAARETA